MNLGSLGVEVVMIVEIYAGKPVINAPKFNSVPLPKMFHHDTRLKMEIFGLQYDVVK